MNAKIAAVNISGLIRTALPNYVQRFVTLGSFITFILRYLFPLAGLLVLIYLIFGGYQIMFSGGNPQAIAQGKSKVTNAIVGFIIVFTAFWIVQGMAIVLGLADLVTIFGQ
ncbi:MAG: hypothetical protein US53_C0068G0015 [Candidatus Woesebacteria bacterium GW2011_GWA1_37_7]|uniref:Uncharacterized protein n=2 Tax=Candidatus Woeseibacteriota TaxID=1752722 RepID=A0A0G0JGP9_9BACT|nr:MAG: hypothetical protein US53_C0068G0015 [Candidatus Woesebacteria bacterium GW2011_GWA1_37_7]OGM19350.1 MAG: hypothetical protein A2685_02235 [Candidatus Woesebacteria bacterium RIFCSPHIGHO2_01_FULL_37_10]